MKVIYAAGKIKKIVKNSIVAIGVFDGVHIGHQALIRQLVKRAKSKKLPSVVLTFYPHPVKVLSPQKYLPYIISLNHRLRLISQLGVDYCIVISFTKKFSQLSPKEFIKRYIVDALKAREVFVGDDFRFGKDRSGSFDIFKQSGKEYGFAIIPINTIKANKEKIGSSKIRELIAKGDIGQAEKYLGRRVSIMGKVIKGDGRGKVLGFPTANISLHEEVLPPLGVYAVYIFCAGKKYKGMANIGYRPSFKVASDSVLVEVNIFDFTKDLYGQEIIVELVKKIREEKYFLNKEALIKQLKQDEKKSRIILKK